MFPSIPFYPGLQLRFSKQLFIGLLLLFVLTNARVQEPIIKGKVKDEKGAPVAFASVTIKGTKTGVQTNVSGEFSLPAKQIPLTLLCSAVGYETSERVIKKLGSVDSSGIVIVLRATESKLDEVVVVGYATSRKMEYTGSVSSTHFKPSDGRMPRTSAAPHSAPALKIKGAMETISKPMDRMKESVAKPIETGKTPDGYKRSKLLTAGEVNDFKKWKMWGDYNESDFKTHATKWDLYATQRYSVLLQNHNHKALAGVKVYLVSTTAGDTLWTGVSDNTGKAELWKGFSSKYENNDLVIRVEQESKTFPAVTFAQGINKITVSRACTVSSRVEIAFVVDATGSMQDEIEYLKEELEDILTKAAAKDPFLNFHTGSVFYRDRGDAYVTSLQPMTAGIDNTLGFIKRQYADGGGDYPEALKEALADATQKLVWSKEARARIIFLLMDAPPHDDAKRELGKIIRHAAAQGIRIVPLACSGTDKATEFIMRSIAMATNGTYLFLTDDSGIGNPHIKPTTDEFKVELLNDLLQRTIEQMCYAGDCSAKTKTSEPVSDFTNIGKVSVYPNPSRGPIVLETNKPLKEIFVADFTGKILYREAVKNKTGRIRLDLSGLPSATYFIRYITADNKTGAEKLVIAR